MIAKVTRGRGFKGLMSYLLTGASGKRPERVAWTSGRNLFTADTDLIPSIMHAAAAQSDATKPVYHLTISLYPSESLERQALERVVDRTLADLGLGDHQAFLVAHNDTGHQHVHVMINRVHPRTARAWRGGHDYARIEKSLRHQERELGLREVKGRHFSLEGRSRHEGAGRSGGDRRFSERTGSSSFGEHVRVASRRDMLEAESWEQLHGRLAEVGLRLKKRGRGLVLSDGEHMVKASFLDRKASLAGLEKRLGPYEPRGRTASRGGSERWREIRELQETVQQLARGREQERLKDTERWDHQARERQVRRLESRLGVASRAFDEQLRGVFRDPLAARRRFYAEVAKGGPHRAIATLAGEPKSLGPLRGRGGPFSSAERWAALDSVSRAAASAKLFLDSRAAHRSAKAGRGSSGFRNPAQGRRDLRLGARTRRQLKRTAARLVKRLGWRLASRVLTPPQYQLLKVTLKAGRLAMDAALELGRGAPR